MCYEATAVRWIVPPRFGKHPHSGSGDRAKPGTRIKLVVQAQSQPDNSATVPLFPATDVRPVHPSRGGAFDFMRPVQTCTEV